MSLQPSGFTSSNSMVQHEQKNKSKDALSTCDSSSEVSDEGYKSSQGNVTNSGTSPNGRSTDLSNKSCANSSETSSHEGKLFSYITFLKSIFYKKGAKITWLHEICRNYPT